MKKTLAIILTIAFFAVISITVLADSYPSKPIDYVVPFDPGGESDLTARLQQKYLEEILGVNVLIKNKPGGGGALGWAELVKEKPTGYSMTGCNLPHTIVQPLMRENTGYETEDVNPVFYFQSTPNILVVPKNSPFNSLEDIINFAKENPGAMTLGGSGSYSANHLGVLELEQVTGATITYIPFTGSGAAIPALLGNHVGGLMTYTTMGVNYKDDIKILAVASEERVPSLPDVPTFIELGYDIVEGAYRGVAVAPGTSAEQIKILEDALRKINQNPEFVQKMNEMGFKLEDYGQQASVELVAKRKEYYTQLLGELGLLK